MSLPSELRALCFSLSNTPATDLPRILPSLLSQVLRCQAPLSSSSTVSTKNDATASASSVLVHKLKTQLSTLLNGRSLEGRFTAVVLIKGVVEVGGWEVLQGSESWVRGLLAILGKSDSPITKELCIITLTKIYCLTHQYQTLVREITTPTLPTFISSCLNLITAKSSGKLNDIPSSLIEVIFRSFASIVPRHTTIYRPFVSQIRTVAKPYLAPTSSSAFVSSSMKQSARCLVVALHQTVAKNAGGEEWGKSVREIVKNVHVTADQVFRAVVEDWESVAGYVADPIDVNQELSGGGKTADDLPEWTGIHAGVERMIGLLGMLEAYVQNETSTPISLPLGIVTDMTTRILSIAIPSSSQSSRSGDTRLHPAIDRDERDGLWTGMPGIYVAALQLLGAMADRLQGSFLPLASTLLDQLAWVFPSGKHDPTFRLVTYGIVSKIMMSVGQSQTRKQISKLSVVIRSCCHELFSSSSALTAGVTHEPINSNGKRPHKQDQNHNADTFLRRLDMGDDASIEDTDLTISASELLPLFASHVPQQYLDISLRSLIERTAILTHNKAAMVACVLNPFVGKNGKAITSILPHLTSKFPSDSVVETLLRPRLPMVPSSRPLGSDDISEDAGLEGINEDEDEDVDMLHNTSEVHIDTNINSVQPDEVAAAATAAVYHGFGAPASMTLAPENSVLANASTQGLVPNLVTAAVTHAENSSALRNGSTAKAREAHSLMVGLGDNGGTQTTVSQPYEVVQTQGESHMNADDSDSDGESVHLVEGLDTDSESDV